MRILIVEDNSTDREVLRYLLEARFSREAKFREADSLATAHVYLDRGDVDCVILDLQLPDSDGKDTFLSLKKRYPELPIVVMTHNQDRDLALDMIQSGAADYVIKNFTNEEELFRRVVFAIERHRRGLKIPYSQIDKAHSSELLDSDIPRDPPSTKRPHQLSSIHVPEIGPRGAPRILTEVPPPPDSEPEKPKPISAVTEMSETVRAKLESIRAAMKSSEGQDEFTLKVMEVIAMEILEGRDDQPSLKGQLETIVKGQKNLDVRVSKTQGALWVIAVLVVIDIVLILVSLE